MHGLVGENGAGKSTLVNIATGILRPSEGQILIEGRPESIASPVAAAERGILAVHQEAELFAELSLAENMLLGRGLIRGHLGTIAWKRTYREAQDELDSLSVALDVRQRASSVSIGNRVVAQIAAAIARRPKILFLDEPTASLTAAESQRIFEQIARLKKSGVSVVYISHRLEEVLDISDEITVLRDGEVVTTEAAEAFDMDRLVALMVGRETKTIFSRNHGEPKEVALELQNLSSPEDRFHNVSFSLHRGEIVGLYGLVGSGRSELARAIFGLEKHAGAIRLDGTELTIKSPSHASEVGLAYVSEDRLTEGIFANHSCQSNVTSAILQNISAAGFISSDREAQVTAEVIDDFAVKLDDPSQPINTLSGGNQQKLILGRWLQTHPKVLLLDEPTRGVDIGAKVEIHRLIDKLAADGMAIFLISSELPEVMGMSDRVLVMCQGTITGQFDPKKDSQDTVATAAFPKANEKQQNQTDRKFRSFALHLRFREMGIVAAIVLVAIAMSVARTEEFATFQNIIDILTSASILSIGAAGITLVIMTGGIDISVGSLLGLVAASAGLAAMNECPPHSVSQSLLAWAWPWPRLILS